MAPKKRISSGGESQKDGMVSWITLDELTGGCSQTCVVVSFDFNVVVPHQACFSTVLMALIFQLVA